MATQADIEHHYDVDNDFFALFLDKKYRAYSCAVWENAIDLEHKRLSSIDYAAMLMFKQTNTF
jgi:cyclopropane fatty-acyl-phospholipid synthase-like methyltransferase